MHFGEFNPLEVLAAAAVQRGVNSQEGNSEDAGQGQTSTSDVADTDDNPDDPNTVCESKTTTEGVSEMDKTGNSSKHNKKEVFLSGETDSSASNPAVLKSDESAGSKDLKPLSVVTGSGSDGLAKSSPGTPSYVIKMVTSNGNKVGSSRSMMALKDATKIIIPNKDGSSKTLTVLKINKPVSNRSSSSLQILNDKPKGEDDEGYCSRSSLDSPGQCSRSDSELCEQENTDLKSPGIRTRKSISPLNVRVIPVSKNDSDQSIVNKSVTTKMLSPAATGSEQTVQTAKKPAKIVIVSRDSNIKNIFSDNKNEKPINEKSTTPGEHVVSPQGGTVLRSLLGEKSFKADAQQSIGISPTNVINQNKMDFTPATSTGFPESKLASTSSSVESNSGSSGSLQVKGNGPVSCTLGSQRDISGIDKIQGTAEEIKVENKQVPGECDTDDELDSVELDTNRNCLSTPSSAGCDNGLDHKFKVPSSTDRNFLKYQARTQEGRGSSENNKCSTVITRSSENSSCTTPSTVVRIVCANKATANEACNETGNNRTPALCNGIADNVYISSDESNTEGDNTELIRSTIDLESVITTNQSLIVSELDETSAAQKSESFQNAFKTFLSNGKPVQLTDLKGLKATTPGGTVTLPQSVLTSLNPQSKVTVVAGGPASQLVTSLASQVLATSHTSQLSKGTVKQTVVNKSAVVMEGKEDEEIVDVTSIGEVASPSPTETKESLKLASSLNQPQITSVVRSIPANNNVSLFTSAIISSKGNPAAKTIPVLINTTNGRKLASVPVTTLVSASTGQSQKPVTYLVMPPQGKGGASLLLPQQLKGHNTLQAAQGLSNIPRYQYIIQDDVPPVIQPNSASVTQQPQTVNLLNIGKPQTSDSWTVLATVDTQGVVSTPGQSAMSHMAKSKTVPVLIKKPVGSDLSLNTSMLQNSIVVSSKGPQSLIPKLMAQPMYQSQKSVSGSASQSNLLVNPNDILKAECTTLFSDNIVKLKNQSTVKSTDKDRDSKCAVDFSDQCLGEAFISSSVVQSSINSSQFFEGSGSDVLKINRTPSKTPTQSAGRGTPSITGRITPLHSLETAPSENTINIKITGSKVIDMRTSEDLSKTTKKQANIGKFGSLSTSWAGLQNSESVSAFGKSEGISRMSSPVMFDSATTSPTSSVEPWSPNPMSPLQIRSDSELDLELLTRPCPKALGEAKIQAQGRRKWRGSTSSTPDLSLIREAPSVSRLHPLIDHDYCMFSEFSADIQSSIIATTESKKKIEKYNQKAKAARTKESLYKVEKNSLKMKKRKYTHRLPLEELRKIRQEKALERRSSLLAKFDSTESLLLSTNAAQISKNIGKIDKPIVKRHAALEKKIMSTKPKRRDNKSYVKITGSFQDDFVYYATKNTRGRPRKYHDSTSPQVPALPAISKKTPIGGINVFDWYRDLSKTDKSTKFGVPEDPRPVSAVKADPYINGITDKSLHVPAIPLGGHTPVHESEVADLVMQMIPDADYNTGITSESDQFIVSTNQSVAQSETVVAQSETVEASAEEKVSQKNPESDHGLASGEENPAYLENMVEQVRNMLNSMGEAELTMLSENLSNSIPSSQQENNIKESDCSTITTNTTTVTTDASDYSSLNAFLGPYSHDGGSNTTQGTGNSFDLDDINDSDLLPSDIGNMNMILGDLNTPKSSASTSVVDPKLSLSALDSPVKNSAPLSLLFSDSPLRPAVSAKQQEPTLTSVNAIDSENHIDKSELFPEVETSVNSSQSQTALQTKVIPVLPAEKGEDLQRPPELTTVSMFWNDLPGLMIHGKQCVRLVDIHKQMLPAKDTGILKKRCQMMNLEITNCSELERDFLIRYANAAKSKSCVVVPKVDAQALVSFYVNPRPRVSSLARQSTGDSRESSSERPTDKPVEVMAVSSGYYPEIDDHTPSPKYTGGKGKGKGKSSRPHSASSERATPASASGKGKGGAQKRKLSPQLDLVSSVPVSSFSEALPSMATDLITGSCELSHPDTQHTLATVNSDGVMFDAPDLAGIKRSERTRNRKVNYAALNSGMYADEGVGTSQSETQELREEQSDTKTGDNNNHKIKVGSSLLNRVVLIKNSPVLKTNAMTNLTVAPVEGQVSAENRYNFQEEIEIRRLRNKQKRRGLNNTEKKKLKRLRERLRVKVKNLKRKIDNLKKNNGLVMSPKKMLVKNMNKSEQQESSESEETPVALADTSKPVSLLGNATSLTKVEHNASDSSQSEILKLEPSPEVSQPVYTAEVATSSAEVGATTSNSSGSRSSNAVTSLDKRKELTEKPQRRESSHRMPLRKVIFPVLHRSNQRGRMQVGNLHYHMYRSRESSCIQCTTCSDFLSVRKFLKHMHHQNMKDELCTVSLPHRLEMAVLEPSADQSYWWGEFKKKRAGFECSPVHPKVSSRTGGSDGRKSSRDSVSKAEVVTKLPQGGLAGEVYCVKVEHASSCSTTQGVVLSSPTASSPAIHLVKVESQGTTHLTTPPPISVLNVTGNNGAMATPTAMAGTRQSTRVRKRKQLHPIESYVYSQPNKSSPEALTESKRLKTEDCFTNTSDSSAVKMAISTQKPAVTNRSTESSVVENASHPTGEASTLPSTECGVVQSVSETDGSSGIGAVSSETCQMSEEL